MAIREIIFRGKRADNGEWVYWDMFARATKNIDNTQSLNYDTYVVFYDDEQTPTFVIKREIGGFEHLDILPETIGEYVGLKDKNGKKVFEGDIVKCCHRWNNHYFGSNDEETFFNQKIKNAYGKYKETTNGLYDNFYYYRNYCIEYFSRNGRYRVRNGGQFHDLTYSFILNHNIEVIGNIHDDKKLLGE